ncbi:MAG: oxidoreductase [Chlorobi bacterium]|nr:oxidoreductase [Chlorobiota bacterium]
MKNQKPKYPGHRITTNGNQLVASYTEALICDAGVFYPITPSTEMGENFQLQFAKGQLNAFGKSTVAVETEGEHAAQGGAIAYSVTGKRVVNFTSGQGIVYGIEQYYHAPGKLSTMVLEVGARALTKHALNVHCGHDDVYAALDTGWNITFAKDAQQASDQAIILRKVNELSLNPGMNCQDGFLTTHLERTFYKPDPQLIREFLGNADDMIECPTEAQKALFGEKRKRVPSMIDLKNPVVMGLVENQEHYMNGVVARRNNFSENILAFFEEAYNEFAELTGRKYGLISEYNCKNADVVFIALGSAAENIEAATDYIEEKRSEKVGIIHINVVRPFPENAIINALRGKKKVIILERTDEPLAGDNPLTREVRGVLSKAIQNFNFNTNKNLEKLNPENLPQIITGVYGLGSRDFRPEGILGAYDFAMGRIARQDGLYYGKGANYFTLGVDHPYAVISDEKPSLLPEKSIAVRLHSIGGWGMITTGKNLGEIIGEFSNYIAKRDNNYDEDGTLKEIIHVSANPKYGSEKKGAPTNYFMVAAPERIRVNCDLKHVNTVLCPDPKIFTHTNPLEGLIEGGAFVWESTETNSDDAWKRIPEKYRKEIIDKKIRLYILHGFEIAKNATNRKDLQLRMQGNAFLGAFFKVSPFLETFNIPKDEYEKTVRAQYVKKFGRFGDAVVESNMMVMQQGFNTVMEVNYGAVDEKDTSAMTGEILRPLVNNKQELQRDAAPIFKLDTFNKEFKAGLGYHQPASVLSSVGLMPSGTGATSSKYVARREVPVYIEENCTQCMQCISVCPDTALPNTAQDISSILITAIKNYVSDTKEKEILLTNVYDIEKSARAIMLEKLNAKDENTKFSNIILSEFRKIDGLDSSISQLEAIFNIVPIAFQKVNAIFKSKEKKETGSGGIFSIFVNDLCKGCGACVVACGSHEALKMVPETEDIYANHQSGIEFLNLLQDTSPKYLGLYNSLSPAESKDATLRNHLMQRSKYEALVSGDGACAGCGEKSVLHSVSTITEAVMRPVFHAKANRLLDKAATIEKEGLTILQELKKSDKSMYDLYRKAVLHLILGYGAENDEATDERINNEFKGNDEQLIEALILVLKQDAENHKNWHSLEGKLANGMSVMAMTANTGCNTVYGSTPPNNPHTYPWMNSLFQDGATIGWLVGESFIQDHARMSVIPERLVDSLLNKFSVGFEAEDYYQLTHFTDTFMTDLEVQEMPKVWAIGGDGGMGDIGYQNVSKVVLQNRPNVKVLLLDTQVYSNTGGQNSDSSVMPGGFDMNQAGPATEGKLTEKKSIVESLMGGHGSPFLAQISMANSAALYRAFIDGLLYRGTAFFQAFTTCQPEHGVADNMSVTQAQASRDSRAMPEIIFNPTLGETYPEIISLKGNPSVNKDWHVKTAPISKVKYNYTVAHWAFTEARFRLHHKVVKKDIVKNMVSLDEKLQLITMDDIVHRRFLNKNHRSYIPKNEIYTIDYNENGEEVFHTLSRQMVLFCVERRKSWRILQSRAGIENVDYKAQKERLREIDNNPANKEWKVSL